ncbi:hypothetical protein MSG28_013122 [Choristoneura fumiferana]|uniref:Uncharacterized protein n=1 Tax=Choristoneura fumiferana TaxID=7141 RepID=A0ACC0KSB2_CHOFU|nr:hypothetical protein MSG28_013122 [Choristoneura fumiferana]
MSIDFCYEDVIKTLVKQKRIQPVSQALLSCKTDNERVKHVYEVLSSLNAFPEVLEVSKTSDLSTYYRNHGNECFKKSEDFKAWQYYNLSLLHAPVESDDYTLALSNRSAVFFSMKKYQESLKDVEQVLSLKYPEKLKDKLTKRQKSCVEILKGESENVVPTISDKIDKILKLRGDKDSTYLCASNKLQVAYNEDMGRHVVAREDIKVGEVLVEEEPYLVLLQKSQYLFSCSYCLSREMNQFPCKSCCFALYCSNQCKELAWNEYHSVECPLMASLVDLKFTKLELLSLRVTIKARSDHADWESLLKTVEDAESNLNSEHRGCILKDNKWIYDSKHYTAIHTLASNVEKRSVSDIFQKAVTAAVFLKFLKDKTDFLPENEEIHNFVGGMLLLHVMTSPTNMHGLSTAMEDAYGKFVDDVSLASAPYAYHSLVNHSCAPNVVRFSKIGSGQMSLFALRPIAKGMQIFDNYGLHHALQNREERRALLKSQYKFICSCEACVDNWPTYLHMKAGFTRKTLTTKLHKRVKSVLNEDAIEKLQKGDKNTAFDLFKPLCKLAEDLDAFAPCTELAECQESLKQCIVIFQGLVPFGYSELVEWEAKPFHHSK